MIDQLTATRLGRYCVEIKERDKLVKMLIR